jgi:hypothetical protein
MKELNLQQTETKNKEQTKRSFPRNREKELADSFSLSGDTFFSSNTDELMKAHGMRLCLRIGCCLFILLSYV